MNQKVMINNDEKTVFELLRNTIEGYISGCSVMLFGSRARKDNSIDSDYDILIVTKAEYDITTKREYKAYLRKFFAKYKIPVDILIHSELEVESKKNISGHIVHQVYNEGIVL